MWWEEQIFSILCNKCSEIWKKNLLSVPIILPDNAPSCHKDWQTTSILFLFKILGTIVYQIWIKMPISILPRKMTEKSAVEVDFKKRSMSSSSSKTTYLLPRPTGWPTRASVSQGLTQSDPFSSQSLHRWRGINQVPWSSFVRITEICLNNKTGKDLKASLKSNYCAFPSPHLYWYQYAWLTGRVSGGVHTIALETLMEHSIVRRYVLSLLTSIETNAGDTLRKSAQKTFGLSLYSLLTCPLLILYFLQMMFFSLSI